MGRSARVLSATAIAVASIFVGLTVPAGASSSARAVIVHRGARVAAVPNSDLSGKGAKAKFTPAKLTAHVFKNQKQCNVQANVSLTITNPTKGSYDLSFNGNALGTLPKNTFANICIYGPAGPGEFEIAGSTHVLTVKFTKS